MSTVSVESRANGVASSSPSLRPLVAPAGARAAEFAALYLILPLSLLASGLGASAAPFAAGATFWTAAALLSMSRGFHWRDLAPRDLLSEWRIFLGAAGFLVLAAAAAGLADGEALPPMEPDRIAALLGWSLVLALTSELFFRALFFRRFGALFRRQAIGVAASGCAFGLFHLALGSGAVEAVYWTAAGATIAAVYRLTGQFWLTVALNTVAGATLATVCACAH